MKKFVRLMCLLLVTAFCVAGFAACSTPKTEYVIGGTGPLEGANSDYGQAVLKGAQIAIDEINAAGGLNGVKFRLEMYHDACSAEKAATAYLDLLEKGMQASIGSVTSGSAKSFADSAKDDNVLCLTPSASDEKVIGAGDHSFRVCFGDPQQGTIAADEMVNVRQYQKIGVIYDTSDTYSSGIYDAFVAQMTAYNKVNGTDYVVRTFDANNKSDFNTQVNDLKSAGCDAIFLPIYYAEAGLIALAAANSNYNVDILGCDGLDGVAAHLDGVTAEVRYITPFDANSTDEKIAAFVAEYKARHNNEIPNQFAADGYDAVMIIYEAMKAAGINDVNISASDLCDALKPVLTGGTFKYTGLTGKDMTWTTGGSCEKQANIVTVTH